MERTMRHSLPIAFQISSKPFIGAPCRNSARQWPRDLSSRARYLQRPTPPHSAHQQSRRSASAIAAAPGTRSKNAVYGTGLVLVLAFGYYYITDTRASIHQWFSVPILRLLHSDPEEAHHAGIRYIKGLYDFNLHPRERGRADQERGDLQVEVFGHILDNPIGTSAGIDKDGIIPSPLLALGPALVEVGGITPHPQKGNDKPRVFRIPSQNALINRYGLNSEGAEYVAMQLRERVRQFAYDNGLGLEAESERQVLDGEAEVPPGSLMPGRLLAVQVAKNKTTSDHDIQAIANDYVTCVEHLAKYADILVVNVSSPNTPGLRDLQAAAPLTAILSAVVDSARSCNRKSKPAVMVKVSPDEDSDAQVEGICSAIWASGVDGVIVGNTTKKRPDPAPRGYIMPSAEEKLLLETGGYSGPQMFDRTLALVKKYRSKLDQKPQDFSPPSTSSQSKPDTQASVSKTTLNESEATPSSASSDLSPDPADASVQRDVQRLKPLTSEAEEQSQQPLLRLPKLGDDELASPSAPRLIRSSTSASSSPPETKQRPSTSTSPSTAGEKQNANPTSSKPNPPASSPSSPSPETPKVIFATGGITNGEQCLEILNAGASLCQVYTAMMYGGVGTVTRMKKEMREAFRRQAAAGADGRAGAEKADR